MHWGKKKKTTPKILFFLLLFKFKIICLEGELSNDGKHNYSFGIGEGSSEVRGNKKEIQQRKQTEWRDYQFLCVCSSIFVLEETSLTWLCILSHCSPSFAGLTESITAPGFSLSWMCYAYKTGQTWQLLHWKQEASSTAAEPDTLYVQGHVRDDIYFFRFGFCWQSWLLSFGLDWDIQTSSGKHFFFLPFWIVSVSFLLTLLLLMFLFGESFSFFFFLRLWDKGNIWLERSVLRAERKQSLRHRTSNIFPLAKQHVARRERPHPSPTAADGKHATNFHGMGEPPEESKLTGLPPIIKATDNVLLVLL